MQTDSNETGANAPTELELTIVMPCLNESETLEACIRKASGYLQTHRVAGEVVIGDNGSTDGSIELAERCGARVVRVAAPGYGSAIYHATLTARGRYVIMGDSDDSYDFSALDPFVLKLREGYDLVMGNRFQGGIRPGAMPWKNRYIGNPILSSIGRLFFRCPARDFHCGLRGFSADAFRRMDLRTTGMEFASEMVIKATLMGLKMTEVPATLRRDGRSRPPHLLPYRDGWRHLRFMLLYSPRWLFLYPGIVLFVLGAALSALLLRGPVFIGGVAFDVNTLLFAAMAILIGFQSVAFAMFTKVFAISEGLLPEDRRLSRVFRYVTLEAGLLVGGLLAVVGVGAWVVGLAYWRSHHFGPLDPAQTLRIVIPGMVCFTLGFQIVMSSFFLSVLGMSRR